MKGLAVSASAFHGGCPARRLADHSANHYRILRDFSWKLRGIPTGHSPFFPTGVIRLLFPFLCANLLVV